MENSRLAQLHSFYEEEPNDPFNIYALAIEYLKTDLEKANSFFDELLKKHESYVPTYYHAAKLLQDIGQREKAIEVYEKGISIARSSNEMKALRELQSAYDELIFE